MRLHPKIKASSYDEGRRLEFHMTKMKIKEKRVLEE
jgi:hypothetical protein